jgi:hypothetical protein
MRKRVIKPAVCEVASADQEWLDVEQLARVEVTSEDAAHPVESALVPLPVYRVGGGSGAPGVAGMQIELPGRRA